MSKHFERWDPQDEQYLALHYKQHGSAILIAAHLGRTEKAVRGKARILGLVARGSRSPWSPEENQLLQEWAESKPFAELVIDWNRTAVRRGWKRRTANALSKKIHRLGFSQEASLGWYTVPALEAGLEISRLKIHRWIKEGKLKAKRKSELESGVFLIQERDLINFVLRYPAEVTERITPDGSCWILQLIASSVQESTISLKPKPIQEPEAKSSPKGGFKREVMKIDTGEVFKTLKEAAEAYDITSGAISNSIRSHYKCCGSHWRYTDD